LPRFADLVVRGELNVPHMHLDIHVYSGNPAERFVFVNMKRYNEGEATAEGPRIERIVPGGVVMEHRGQRFLLSRD
jgi:general secretion pathway protein B